jgi:hypothetical protein
MSPWVIIIIATASSLSFPTAEHSVTAISTSVFAPAVATIDFDSEALCEEAVKKIRSDHDFSTQSAICLRRKP